MKDQQQKDRHSLANSQHRAFMAFLAKYSSDPLAKEWAEKQSIRGAPQYISQIDPIDPRVSGFGVSYTRHVFGMLVVHFNLLFQAGIREMCRTEAMCCYALAEEERHIRETPECAPCLPMEEEDILERDDPYLWQVWQAAERMNLHGIKVIRKSDLGTMGKKNMEEMAECVAGAMNPMIAIAISARNSLKKK